MTFPSDLLTQTPMLAQPSKNQAADVARLTDTDRYIFDVKWDGVRCLAYIDNGEVTLRTRSGQTVTNSFPEVVEALTEAFPAGALAFDGELVCFGTNGKPDFGRISRRAHASPTTAARLRGACPVTLVAFDLLFADGDLRRKPQWERLALLQAWAKHFPAKHLTASQWTTDGRALWTFCQQQELEGVIAKERTAGYVGSRSHAWVKLKCCQRITAIVTGYEEGKGSRKGKIGKLFVSLLNDAGQLVPVGKVGSGFREADHAPMLEILKLGEPFFVEVEFLEFTHKDRVLRHPSYKGVRTDITMSDCTFKQIGVR